MHWCRAMMIVVKHRKVDHYLTTASRSPTRYYSGQQTWHCTEKVIIEGMSITGCEHRVEQNRRNQTLGLPAIMHPAEFAYRTLNRSTAGTG